MKKLTTMVAVTITLAVSGCAGTAPQQATVLDSTMPSVGSVAGQASTIGTIGGLSSGSPLATQTPELAGLLAQQLGISPVQAMGGAGSIFSVAKQAMSPGNFGLVSNSVPGMSQLLAATPSLAGSAGGAGGLMGQAASAFGGGNSLGQMAMLASSFQNLGLNTGMINQFIPVILQYVQSQGGPSTMGLLQGALMP